MKSLTVEQAAEYFHRSYTAVDGLWFMKVEEKYGFEEALEIDDQVWKVLPKIQARALKNMLGLDEGIKGLCQGIAARLALEGFEFERSGNDDGFKVSVKKCPWQELMIRSGRKHLSDRISSLICKTENTAWASEFGDIDFELEAQICKGADCCLLSFRSRQSDSARTDRTTF